MSEKKVFVILGSKNDELTAKLLKSFENCSINYILIDLNYGIHVVEVKDWSTDKIKLVEYLEEAGEWIFQLESIRGNIIERRSNPEDQVLKYRNDILKSLKSYKDLRTNENHLKFKEF